MSPNGSPGRELVPISATDLAAHAFDLLVQRDQRPVMSDLGRADAVLGAELILEAYGVGEVTTRSVLLRSAATLLRLVDAGHSVPVRDLTGSGGA